MGEFCMPSLGADMERGVLLEWRVQPGDAVRRGEIVAVVDTDKSDVEVEVFEDGVVTELLVAEGEEVPVGTPLARIDTGGVTPAPEVPGAEEAATAAPPPAAAPSAPPTPPPPPPHPPAATRPARVVSPIVRRLAAEEHLDLASIEPSGPGGIVHRVDVERALEERRSGGPVTAPGRPAPTDRPRASPYARRLAAERDADLTTLSGTGPEGAVVARDLTEPTLPPAAPAPESPTAGSPTGSAGPPTGGAGSEGPPPDDGASAKATAMRRAIAQVMARSKREIPHFYLQHPIDLAEAMTWIGATNVDRPPTERILPAALLLKATALAARRVPGVNGFWLDEAFQPAEGVDLGVAIGLRGGGVVTPAIAGADTLALDDLMARLRDLVGRARAGSVRSSETSGTLTVTNLGDGGVATVLGVISPPQVALVGFGGILEQPVAHDGMLAVHPVVQCTLSADHRAVDGHLGSRFLRIIDDLLQHPEGL
jgi:pyruvate dehydrogenase E2 component (dihydrolipoamide acetyltransferase)